MHYELGVIGAGNMAEAIARGLIARGVMAAGRIIAADPSAARRGLFEELGTRVGDNAAVASQSRTVLLSVKPQSMADALTSIASSLSPDTLVISIAAGISTRFIEDALSDALKPATADGGELPGFRVIRAMPNTPMLVGQGMAGICRGRHATDADLHTARTLFESSARVVEVPENLMDAVTAVSGSGPAYFFYLVQHMIAAGVEMGLEPETARTLAVQTAVGSAQMLTQSPDTPEELRRKVTSPGGTTQAAIETLDARQVGSAIVAALVAAEKRGRELGR